MSAFDIPVADEPLFFLDYDGSLAPIVNDPMKAFPHPEVPQLLQDLEESYPLWIITGRYLADLSHFLDRPYRAVGLHGMQEGIIGGEVVELLDADERDVLADWRSRVPPLDGLQVEEKGPTFALHYRQVEDADTVENTLDLWLKELPSFLEVIRGKKVYEIRPRSRTKGTAVAGISSANAEHTPVYIGDDVTDEDAFKALNERGPSAITIKVGEGDTSARYRLSGPSEVVAYLKRYVEGESGEC